MVKIIRDDGTNPILEISAAELTAFCRAKADQAGFADRSMGPIQISVDASKWEKIPDDKQLHHWGALPITLMVSNVADIRPDDTRDTNQEFAIRNVLIGFTGQNLTPNTVDKIVNDLMAEIRDGGSSWAFKQ